MRALGFCLSCRKFRYVKIGGWYSRDVPSGTCVECEAAREKEE